MQPFLRTAYIDYLCQQPPRRSDRMLWVSDLGMHPFKAMNRILNGHSEPFPPATISAMADGEMIEAHSASIWSKALAATVHLQLPLFTHEWSGYADIALNLGTERPTLIEHKTTKDAGWNYNKQLGPIKSFHCCQLWLYGQLFKERYGIEPDLVLYYRSMGDHWAELNLTTDDSEFIFLDGQLDGKAVQFTSNICPRSRRDELEYYFRAKELPAEPVGTEWDYAGKLTLL